MAKKRNSFGRVGRLVVELWYRYGPWPKPVLGWYASHDDETFTLGPFESFEELVAQAKREGMGEAFNGVDGCNRFYVVEAAQMPIRLSRYLDGDVLLEHVTEAADDDLGGEEGCIFDDGCGTAEQTRELDRQLRRVVDRWQRKYNLVFHPWQFTHVGYRNSYTWFSVAR